MPISDETQELKRERSSSSAHSLTKIDEEKAADVVVDTQSISDVESESTAEVIVNAEDVAVQACFI